MEVYYLAPWCEPTQHTATRERLRTPCFPDNLPTVATTVVHVEEGNATNATPCVLRLLNHVMRLEMMFTCSLMWRSLQDLSTFSSILCSLHFGSPNYACRAPYNVVVQLLVDDLPVGILLHLHIPAAFASILVHLLALTYGVLL